MRKQFPLNWLPSGTLAFMIQCVIFFICWLRLTLTHWSMKVSLAKVNWFTENCFRMVHIVSKNNFVGIKTSQGHEWETRSLTCYDLLTFLSNACKSVASHLFEISFTLNIGRCTILADGATFLTSSVVEFIESCKTLLLLLFFRWQVATKSVFIRPLHPAFITTIWNYSNSWVKCWEKLYTRYPSFSIFCMTHFDIFCLSNNFLTKTLFVTQELPLFYKKVFFPTQADFSSFICRF